MVVTIGQKFKALELGKFMHVDKILPIGSLEARKLSRGAIKFYWRFTHLSKTQRADVGIYDSSAPPKSITPTKKGVSIEAARRIAQELSVRHYEAREEGGHAALKQAKREEQETKKAEADRVAVFTLERLMDEYVNYLVVQGNHERTAGDVRSMFRLHVKEPFPVESATPANQVTKAQLINVLRRLVEQEHERTSDKVRSYLRAAFQVAIEAESSAAIPRVFLDFHIELNPVAAIKPVQKIRPSGKSALSLAEARLYWKLIKDVPGLRGAVLRLHLLTGGQRIAQLLRIKTHEQESDLLRMWDTKGRAKPRSHLVPLLPAAIEAFSQCSSSGTFALSTDGGATSIAPMTFTNWSKAAVGDKIPKFNPKRIRSALETILSRAGITREIRGRLQSHGITGIQEKHYNEYDFLPEKKRALEIWELWLQGTPELMPKVEVSSI